MPTRRIEYVNQPFAGKRYTPDTARIQALYLRLGEDLAAIGMRKGANQARVLENLGQLFSGYRADKLATEDAKAAAARRDRERAEDKAFQVELTKAERAARAEERKADREERQTETDRAAGRWAVDNTVPGPVSPVLAALAERFPELAGRFRQEATLPATVTPGAVGEVSPERQTFPVLEPSAPVVARERERAADAAARSAEARRELEARKAERAEDRAFTASENAKNRAATLAGRQMADPKFFIRNGEVVPLRPNEVTKGDIPYSAEAMQGIGGEAADVRTQRTAAAMNAIEKLKTLAPKRSPGLPGMIEGAGERMKAFAGYNPPVRQYEALLQPTAMLMAVAVQGAAGLSNAEREAMAKTLGSIATMDYDSQMALLENAAQMLRTNADVTKITVKDPETGQPVEKWVPAQRARPLGSVTIGQPGATAPAATAPKILSIVPVPK